MNAALELGPSSRKARLVGREAFAALRSDWTRIADAMPNATPFVSWEWAAAWLETIGRDVEARFVLLEDETGICAILPFAASLSSGPVPGARRLTSCAVDDVYPDQLEPVAAAQDLPTLLDSALDLLWADGLRWDCVRLPMLAEDSPFAAELERRAQSPGRSSRMERREATTAPFLPISVGYEDFLKTLSSNERYKIRNRSKKLLTGRDVEYSDLGAMESVEALALLRALHAKRAEQKGIRSTFDTEPVQRFHERLLRELPKERVVWRCLRSGSDIFAMFYGFRVRDRLFYFQLGYDPAWSEFSAGLVLLSQTIREAFESGCREYNFLQGNEPFKSTWTRSARRLNDWTIYRPDFRGELLYRLNRTRAIGRAGVVQVTAAVRAVRAWRDARRKGG